MRRTAGRLWPPCPASHSGLKALNLRGWGESASCVGVRSRHKLMVSQSNGMILGNPIPPRRSSCMTDHSNDMPELNLVAIDVAKQWNMVLLKDSSGHKRTFKVANTAADHEQLIRFLMALSGKVRIAFEPTGDYPRAASLPTATSRLSSCFHLVRRTSSLPRSTLRHLGQERSKRRPCVPCDAGAWARADVLRSAL